MGLAGAAAKAVKRRVRGELVALVRGVRARLKAHQLGGKLAMLLEEHLDAAMVYLLEFNRGLARVSPGWCWWDFRLRLSRGRNHGSGERLERAARPWAIYRNLELAQGMSSQLLAAGRQHLTIFTNTRWSRADWGGGILSVAVLDCTTRCCLVWTSRSRPMCTTHSRPM